MTCLLEASCVLCGWIVTVVTPSEEIIEIVLI
jgi:hypothetical protein